MVDFRKAAKKLAKKKTTAPAPKKSDDTITKERGFQGGKGESEIMDTSRMEDVKIRVFGAPVDTGVDDFSDDVQKLINKDTTAPAPKKKKKLRMKKK